jgi:hypothetical protein
MYKCASNSACCKHLKFSARTYGPPYVQSKPKGKTCFVSFQKSNKSSFAGNPVTESLNYENELFQKLYI